MDSQAIEHAKNNEKEVKMWVKEVCQQLIRDLNHIVRNVLSLLQHLPRTL